LRAVAAGPYNFPGIAVSEGDRGVIVMTLSVLAIGSDEFFLCLGVPVLLALLAGFPLAIAALVKIANLRERVEHLEQNSRSGASPAATQAPVPPTSVVSAPSRPPAPVPSPISVATAAPPPVPVVPPPVVESISRPPGPVPPISVAPVQTAGSSVFTPDWREKFRLEEFIGLKFLAWAGVIVLLVGMALLAKYFSLGVMGRVIAEASGGLALLVAGEILSRRKYTVVARVCTGGGLAMEYFAAFSAGVLYQIMPQAATWSIMAGITAVSILLAVRYSSLAIAILSIVGGIAGPILIHPNRDPGHTLFLYLLALNVGVLTLAYFRKWRLLNLLALTGTLVNLGLWLAEYYWVVPVATQKLPFIVSYLSIFWFVYFLVELVYHTMGSRENSPLDLPVTTINIVWFFGILYALLREDHHVWLGPLAVALGLVYLAQALAIQKYAPRNKPVVLLNVAQAVVLFTLAIPIALDGVWIPMAWAAEACVLVWLGRRLEDWRYRVAGALMHIASIGALFYFMPEMWRASGMLVFNTRVATFAVVGTAMLLSSGMCRQLKLSENGMQLMWLGTIAGHFVLMGGIVYETYRWHETVRQSLGYGQTSQRYQELDWRGEAIAAAGLAVYAMAAAVLASALRWILHHAMAITAFAFAFAAIVMSFVNTPAEQWPPVWNKVGATYGTIVACLLIAENLAKRFISPPEKAKGFWVTYELGAWAGVLLFYFVELCRFADGKYLPELYGDEAMYYALFAAAFAVYAGVLMLRGLRISATAHQAIGVICMVVGIMFLYANCVTRHAPCETLLWNPRGVAYVLLIASMSLAARAYSRRNAMPSDLLLAAVMVVLVHAAALACFTLETRDFWTVRAKEWFSQEPTHAWYARHMTLSIGYALYAFLLLTAGILQRSALLRWLALIVLGGTVLKVFFYDLSQIEALWRILSFLCLGLLLLGGSLLYHKYRAALSFVPKEVSEKGAPPEPKP
jgi:uncharacterized membrane protein